MAEIKSIVRIGDKDIPGDLPIWIALTRIKGVSFMFSNAVCCALGLDKDVKVGSLTDEMLEKVEDCLRTPDKYGVPAWLYNRRKDMETGQDKHLISSDLRLQQEMDIRFLKKIKCYRGIRHALGLKVRGQRTRTTGRKGRTIGVQRKKK